MKRIIMASWLMCCVLGAAAQDQEITIKKVKKGEEPKAVMESIKNNFPKAVSENLSYLPGILYGEEWHINVTSQQLKDMDFFQIDMKEGNKKYTAVYDKSGKLLSSKEEINPAVLPAQVQETINKYIGWHTDNSTELIKYNGKKVTDVYKVKLQKDLEHKILFLDKDGNVINTRFAFF